MATPLTATTLVYVAGAELKLPGPEAMDSVTESVEPVPEVMTLPLTSSMATLTVLRAVPAVPVAGGLIV